MTHTKVMKKITSILLSAAMLYNGMFSNILNTVSVVNAETTEDIVDTAPVSDTDLVTVSDRVKNLSYVSDDEEQQDELYRYSIKIEEKISLEELLVQSGFLAEEDIDSFLTNINTVQILEEDSQIHVEQDEEGKWFVQAEESFDDVQTLVIKTEEGKEYHFEITDHSIEPVVTVYTESEERVHTGSVSVRADSAFTDDVTVSAELNYNEDHINAVRNSVPVYADWATFDIGVSEAKESYHVSFVFPETVKGNEYRLFHVEEDGTIRELDGTVDTTEIDGEERAAGISFDSEVLGSFVFAFTKDYEYWIEEREYGYSITSDESVALRELLVSSEVITEEYVDLFMANIESVNTEDPSVLTVEMVDEVTCVLRPVQYFDVVHVTVTMSDGQSAVITVTDNREKQNTKDTAVTAPDDEEIDLVSITPTKEEEVLPEEAESRAEVVNGEGAIAAVEEHVQETQETPVTEEAPATEYKVFDIGLENVDTEEYESFDVELKLNEKAAVYGSNFKLYHIKDDGTVEEIPVTVNTTVDSEGNEIVEGLSFTTPSFSEFVLVYTVDFHWGEYTYQLQGGGSIYLSELLKIMGSSIVSYMPEDSERLLSLAEHLERIESVEFSDLELLEIKKVEQDIEGDNDTDEVQNYDWLLHSLKPFETEETLLINLLGGESLSIRVTDATNPIPTTYEAIDSQIPGSIVMPGKILEPSDEEKAILTGYEVPGDLNNYDADKTKSKDLIWKKAEYDAETNTVTISLAYFQKRYGSKIDFIFMMDESGTMGHNENINGTVHTRAEWARLIAAKASRDILNGNNDETGNDNRIMFIPWSSVAHPSSFMTSEQQVLNYINTTPFDYAATYHGRAVQAAITQAQASVNEGRVPVVIYLSDFAGHAQIRNGNEYYFNQNDVDKLNDLALVYPLLVYPAHHTQSFLRMYNLCPDDSHHYSMGNDPSGLLQLFNQIIEDATCYIDKNIKVTDSLSASMQGNMAESESSSVWEMKEVDESGKETRMRNGVVHYKTYTYQMSDSVLSGEFETNQLVTITNGSTELNRITDSPKLGKGVDFIVQLKSEDGEETDATVPNALFILKNSTGTALWQGYTDENGKLSIPYKYNNEVLLHTGSSYILEQTSTNTSYAKLPDKTWTLSINNGWVITSSVTGGSETELTKNLSARKGHFIVWNIGTLVPLVPLYIQKIWGETAGQTVTSVNFTILGVDPDTGKRYPLTAYESNRTKTKMIPDQVTELKASDVFEGTPWARLVYVPAYQGDVKFYDKATNSYAYLSDGTFAYKMRENGIIVSGSAPKGNWSSVEGENNSVTRQEKYTEVTDEGGWRYYTGYENLGPAAHSNPNMPSGATDYRFELEVRTSDNTIKNQLKEATSLTFLFEVNSTGQLAQMDLTFNSVNIDHNSGYFHVVHTSVPWSGLDNGGSSDSYKSKITPKKLIIYGDNTDNEGCVLYDVTGTNRINYLRLNNNNINDPYVGFISKLNYGDAANDHRLRRSESLQVYDEPQINEEEITYSTPYINLTNNFNRTYAVNVGTTWMDSTVDSDATANEIASVTYQVYDTNGSAVGEPVTVPKGQQMEIDVPETGTYTVKQLSYALSNGRTVSADEDGLFAAYTVAEPVKTVSVSSDAQVAQAQFENTRRQLNSVKTKTTFAPANDSLNNVVFPVEIQYGTSDGQKRIYNSTAADGEKMIPDTIPVYRIDGTDVTARVRTDDVLSLITDDAIKTAYLSYDTRTDITEIKDSSGYLTDLNIAIDNNLVYAPVVVQKQWVDDSISGDNNAKAGGTASVTVRFLKNGTTPIIPDEHESEEVVLTAENNWQDTVYLPIGSVYTVEETKIGNKEVADSIYIPSYDYSISSQTGTQPLNENALTRDGSAVLVINTMSDAIARVCVWDENKEEEDQTWTYHEYLINSSPKTGRTILEGAFDQANTLTGDIVIETLRESAVIDGQDRYTLTSGFTFNKVQVTSLTIKTTPNLVAERKRSTLTKEQTAATKSPMIIFDISNSKLMVEDLIFEGGGSEQKTNGTGGLLRITKDTSSLTISNSTFNKAQASDNGGAVYSAGAVSLINDKEGEKTIFTTIQSSNKFGGAVYAGKALTLTNVYTDNQISFDECHIYGGTSSDGGGGAIHSGTILTFNGGMDGVGNELGNNGKIIFENCSSTTDGGAASALSGFAANNNRGEILFRDCSTTKTDAVGGALVCFNNKGTLSITNIENGKTSFENCVGATNGGAIAKWSSGTVEITGTANNPVKFIKCHTTKDNGGAIMQQSGGTMTLTNVVFGNPNDSESACYADGSGGAVYTAGSLSYINSSSAGIGSYYSKANRGNGGAFFSSGAMTITSAAGSNMTFKQCTSKGEGGAFYASGEMTITNSAGGDITFEQCSSGGAGGALRDSTLEIINTGNGKILFNACHATNDGGTIYSGNTLTMDHNNGQIKFDGCYLTGTGDFEGGAVYVNGGGFNARDNSGSIIFNNCYTNDNHSSGADGGAIACFNCGVDIESVENGEVKFINCRNVQTGNGGAIYTYSDSGKQVIIKGANKPVIFENCFSTKGGGGAIWQHSGSNMELQNVIFGKADNPNMACTAINAGGAVRANGSLVYRNTLTSEIGVYRSKTTNEAGGAFWVGGDVAVECTESSGTIRFDSCKTEKNGQGGGAIWQNGGSTMVLTNAVFGDKDDASKACVSKGNGGAIRANGSVTYTNNTGSELGIYNSTTNNQGEGGAIFAQGNVSLSGITIKNCTAKTFGGAVYQISAAEYPELYLGDCVIENNSAANSGGAIYSNARKAGFHNNVSVTNNRNTQTNVVNAAGIYFTPEDTIITITGDSGTAEITIYDNKNNNTVNSEGQSNLKMGIGAPAIEIKGLHANGGLSGHIGIVNPAKVDRWFGRSDSNKVCGEATINHDPYSKGLDDHFSDDTKTYFSKYQGSLNRRLIWAPLPKEYVCKITDANGNLLKYDFGEGYQDAVFTTLSDAFGALGDYIDDPETFEGNVVPAFVKMLEQGDNYNLSKIIYVPDNLDITLTTASHEDSYYPGPADDIATITRDNFYGSMFVMSGTSDNTCTFTVKNIELDGGGSSYRNDTYNQNGGIIRANAGGCRLTLAEGAVLQNSSINKHNGAGVYMAAGSFVMGGGTLESGAWTNGAVIKNCRAESGNGGGIYLAPRVSSVEIKDGSTLTDNYASGDGGAVYTNVDLTVNDAVFINSNAAVNRAANGGAIYASNTCDNVSVANTTFTDVRSSTSGGAVFSDAKTKTEITGSTFKWTNSGQYAAKEGGAVYANNTVSILSISGSTLFDGIRTSSNGGAVFSKAKTELTGDDANNAMFKDCYAAISGGALFTTAQTNVKDLLITGCSAAGTGVSGSKPANGGGGIYTSAVATLDNVSIKECTAFSGGAVYSTNNSLILKNGTKIVDNKLSANAGARVHAAGVYMYSESSVVTFGGTDVTGDDSVSIKDNKTQQGEDSNLRISMNGINNKDNSVKVLGNLSGEIHIVNPGNPGTRFGYEEPGQSYTVENVFFADYGSRTSERRDSDKLYWADGEYVCKITDSGRNLLHVGGADAVYYTLTDAFAAFGSKTFDGGTPVNIEIFKPSTDVNGYDGLGVYVMEAGINVPGKTITLRTAAADATEYPYTSGVASPCVVLRGNTARTDSMFKLDNAASNLTFEDIVIDGQSSKSQFTSSHGGAVLLNKSGAQLTIKADAVVRDAESANNGGGVYRVNGARLTLDPRTTAQGAAIYACKAKYGGGIFDDSNAGNVDVTNWYLKDCVATANGGGIYFSKAVTLTTTDTTIKLEGCKAATGGGIHAATSITVNCKAEFEGCEATANGGGLSCSGALTVNEKVLCKECKASSSGGGIYTPQKGSTDSILAGAEFIDCSAGANGGGICFAGTDTNNYHYAYLGGDIIFTRCTAGAHGGGLYKGISGITFNENCTVTAKGCKAGWNGTESVAGGNGGAIYGLGNRTNYVLKKGVTITLGGSETSDACSATGSGGGIFIGRDIVATEEGITITAENCTAGVHGGGLFVNGLNGSGTSIELKNCSAGNSGGGIFVNGERYGTYTLANGTLTTGSVFKVANCTATSGHGGGAYVGGPLTAAYKIEISSCTAGGSGGGIYTPTKGSADYITAGAEIINCTAGVNGGGICDDGTDSNNYHLLYLGGQVTLTNCIAGGSGGGLYKGISGIVFNENCELTAKNCHASTGSGGAIYGRGERSAYTLKKGVTIEIGGTADGEACTAGASGGGICINRDVIAAEEDISISVTRCSAGANGGGLYVNGLNGSGASVLLTNCTAGTSGGGLYCNNTRYGTYTLAAGTLTTGGVFQITNCTATTGHGGGTFVGGPLTAEHKIIISSCTAGGNGGGIYSPTKGNANSITAGAEITNCTAGGNGGAICDEGTDSNTYHRLTLGGQITLANCTASGSGGGIYKGISGIIMNENTAFTAKGCRANGGNGGVIYGRGERDGYVIGKGSTIILGGSEEGESCFASGNGGGLYINHTIDASAGNITINATKCMAGSNGGAIYAAGVLNIDGADLSFTDCYAKVNGGGIYYAHNSAVSLTNIPFTRCKAGWDGTASVSGGNGGGIYKASNNLTLSGVTFTDCYASANGASLYYAPASILTIKDGTSMTGGTVASGGRGSAIFVNSTATVNFEGGTAEETTTDPITGDPVTAPKYGVLITDNRGGGAVEVKNDTGAVLKFSGNVKIQDNLGNLTSGEGIDDVQKNVVLSNNNNTTIQTTTAGLSEHAYVGIYVIDGANYFNTHGKRAQDFGTYAASDGNKYLENFHNDRNGYWGEVDTDKSGSLIRWYGPLVKITDMNDNLLYYNNNAGALKPAVFSTLKSGFEKTAQELFYIGGENSYGSDTPIKLKLLDDDEMTVGVTYTAPRNLTFTTAETEIQSYMPQNEDTYLYSGEAKDGDGRAILSRGNNTSPLIKINTNNTFTAEKLTVDGNSDLGRTGRMFQIEKTSLDDGNDATTDGAVFRNMRFYSCKSDYGSAIFHNYVETAPLTITNVTFGALKESSASKSRLALAKDADVDMTKACEATSQGGSVYVKSKGKVTVTNSSFYGSTGRAIYMEHGTVTTLNTTLDSCDFIGCSSTSYGAALCDDDGDNFSNEMIIRNCVFTDCVSGSWSGAVLGRAKMTTVSDSTFRNCWPTRGSNHGGGALHIQYNAAGATAEVTRSSFINCHIGNGNGGAIYFRNNKDSAIVAGCEFDNCYGNNGGAVYSDKTTVLTIKNASRPTAAVTAGTSVGNTDTDIKTTFINCRATNGNGGAVYNTGGTTLSISDTVFGELKTEDGSTSIDSTKKNTASGSGGAVYSNASTKTELTNCVFYGNSANNGGGIYFANGNGALNATNANRMTDCVMAGNTAAKNGSSGGLGGAVFIVNSKALTIHGGSISNLAAVGTMKLSGNTANGTNGGAINVGGINARLYFEGDAVIYDNGDSDADGNITQKNVVLDQTHNTQNNVNAIINTTAAGLDADAHIGIYVTGTMTPKERQTDPFKNHGNDANPFGTYDKTTGGKGSDNLECFSNDRDENLFGILGSGTNAAFIVWGTAGVDVWFMKVNGSGEKLSGAEFTLYTSKECAAGTELKKGDTVVTGIAADGSATYKDKDKSGTEINRPIGKVVFEKVPNGIYYMKETKTPVIVKDGKSVTYPIKDSVYVVIAGAANLTRPSTTDGTPWAEVLSNITNEDITAYTGTGEDKLDFAIFEIDGDETSATYRKAITVPDIKTFGIVNTGDKQTVTLRKVDSSDSTALEGAWFRIFSYDLKEVINSDYKTESGNTGFKSNPSGVYFIDSLPTGKYYVVEMVAPTKKVGTNTTAYSANVGKVFIVEVKKDEITNPITTDENIAIDDVLANLKTLILQKNNNSGNN